MGDLSGFSARPRLRALLDHIAEMRDARQVWKAMYPLREVLFRWCAARSRAATITTTSSSGGNAHLAFLRGFAEFHFGIPCAD
jgi:hypothetical protein